MRLIDVHGSYTVNASDNTGYSIAFGGGIISVADEFGHIVAEFDADDAPTIEAEPVKHGCWVGTSDGYADGELVYDMWECSECGYDADGAEEKPNWNFCPNCGADMRERRDNA